MPKTQHDSLELVHELRRRLGQQYGDRLVQLVLFGSQARGDATVESDVDVLVVLRGDVPHPGLEIDAMMDIIYDLTLRYEQTLSVLPVSEKDFRARQSPLLINIRREGVCL